MLHTITKPRSIEGSRNNGNILGTRLVLFWTCECRSSYGCRKKVAKIQCRCKCCHSSKNTYDRGLVITGGSWRIDGFVPVPIDQDSSQSVFPCSSRFMWILGSSRNLFALSCTMPEKESGERRCRVPCRAAELGL